MRRALLVLALTAALAACKEKAPAKPVAAPAEPPRSNLLHISSGAVVISRTDEAMLQQGAPAAIDGDAGSFYSTPRGDTAQSIVVALPSRTRLDAVGAATTAPKQGAVRKLAVESSLDGKTFSPLITIPMNAKDGDQWTKLASPSEATHLRFSILEAGDLYGIVPSLLAAGSPTAPRRATDASGCWSLNTAPGRLAQRGVNVAGVFAPEMAMVGAGETNFYRVVWLDGPLFGLGAFSVDAESLRLSGVLWHERAEDLTVGEYWMGERTTACSGPESQVAYDGLVATWLARAGWLPLFGIVFDERDALRSEESRLELDVLSRMISTGRPLSIEAHEFRGNTPDSNRARAATRIKALQQELTRRKVDLSRTTFTPAGSDAPPHKVAAPLNRAMYSTIIVRVAG